MKQEELAESEGRNTLIALEELFCIKILYNCLKLS
jgi:hypothetical protein